MKRIILLLLIFLPSLYTFADEYQIKEISNANSIRINGKVMGVNDVFSDKATIGWTAENQFIAVKNLTRTESVRKFYRNKFAAQKTQSISEYLLKVGRLDTRDKRSSLAWIDGKNKNNFTEKRIALIIGNSDYEYLKYIENAVKDANLVASKLNELGFDVATCYDGNITDMKDALHKFSQKAVGYDIALFYYAGHGIQDSEKNISYMLPLDIDIENDGRDYVSERSCLSALDIRDQIQRAQCRANILLFDACRSNTIVRGFRAGLFSMEAGPKTLVMYSTANGETAMDRFGQNNNGPFAYAFAKCLEEPGLSLPNLIKKVQLEVKDITHNLQIPNPSGDNIEEMLYLNSLNSNSSQYTSTPKQEIFSESNNKPSPSYEDFTVNGVTFRMIKVEGGTFTMGATPEIEKPSNNEKPAHQVTLSSYFIGETEVTQGLWNAVMGKKNVDHGKWSKSYGLGDNYPAYYLSWYDCQKFIQKLNNLTGKNFRLPTEAEWEFAARGGNKSHNTQYSGSSVLDEVAWYSKDKEWDKYGIIHRVHYVKTKMPNELGIYDMSGNVAEWCANRFYEYNTVPKVNPQDTNTDGNRMFRGGHVGTDPSGCTVSTRCGGINRYSLVGFRIALTE